MSYITTNKAHLQHINIVHPEGESMKIGFDGGIKLEFHGAYDAKVVRHSGYITFQIAEVVIDKRLFAERLSRIERLRYSSV